MAKLNAQSVQKMDFARLFVPKISLKNQSIKHALIVIHFAADVLILVTPLVSLIAVSVPDKIIP